MTELQLPRNLRRVPHLAQRRLGDEVVVMDVRKGILYGFNPPAGELLDWLKPGRELAALEALEPDTAQEIRRFLGELLEQGLVEAGDRGEAREPEPAMNLVDAPRLLWREEAARVVNQTSPPQAITNPQCQF